MHFLVDKKGNDSFWLTFKPISPLQNTLQLNLLFTQLRNLFFTALLITGGILKKTGAGQEFLLRELLYLSKGRCFLPFFNLSYIDPISDES